MAITFIKKDDVTDTILDIRDSDVLFANAYLYRLAGAFGLKANEMDQEHPAPVVVRLGCAVACRECAADMVGADPTVAVDGNRREDIYYQKYKLYAAMVKDLESRLTYADFASDSIDSSGKGGVGMIKLSRA